MITRKSLNQAYKRQSKALTDSFCIVNGASCALLMEVYGWKREDVIDLASIACTIWQDLCEQEGNESVFELCERETGIEMKLDGYESYHDFPYLDHKQWKYRKFPSLEEEYHILIREIAWIPTMMMACNCIALQRKAGWDFERLSKYCQELDCIRKEKNKARYYRKLIMQEYKIQLEV